MNMNTYKIKDDLDIEKITETYRPVILDMITTNNYNLESNLCIILKIESTDNTAKKIKKIKYGVCEDCSQITILRREDACMDGNECCIKYICMDDCIGICKNGHVIPYYNSGYSNDFNCDICSELINVHNKWWGLSPDEHIKKYG